MTTIDSMTAQELHEHGVGHAITGEDTTCTYIARQDEGSSRWHHGRLMVLSDDAGQLWGLPYSVGATEEQENEYPWDSSNERLELTRLYPHTVTTVQYRTKPAAEATA